MLKWLIDLFNKRKGDGGGGGSGAF